MGVYFGTGAYECEYACCTSLEGVPSYPGSGVERTSFSGLCSGSEAQSEAGLERARATIVPHSSRRVVVVAAVSLSSPKSR
jgi:hypothetical protein